MHKRINIFTQIPGIKQFAVRHRFTITIMNTIIVRSTHILLLHLLVHFVLYRIHSLRHHTAHVLVRVQIRHIDIALFKQSRLLVHIMRHLFMAIKQCMMQLNLGHDLTLRRVDINHQIPVTEGDACRMKPILDAQDTARNLVRFAQSFNQRKTTIQVKEIIENKRAAHHVRHMLITGIAKFLAIHIKCFIKRAINAFAVNFGFRHNLDIVGLTLVLHVLHPIFEMLNIHTRARKHEITKRLRMRQTFRSSLVVRDIATIFLTRHFLQLFLVRVVQSIKQVLNRNHMLQKLIQRLWTQ
mmetsp:Transcript_59622/g.98400  ORF Transcript_59622/g.98400 Transcript_59622/m.98400 type:complete len:297 (+) Transcript_59622:555-1445(+)